VNVGEEEAFANAVIKPLSQPGMREELGRNGREFAQKNFSLESILMRYRDCYERLLEKKSMRNSLAR
jgi:glycosyltransferase involved in cell wall biosynthesis